MSFEICLLLLLGVGVRAETDPQHAGISVLSWDTEGTGRTRTSLLRRDAALSLRVRVEGKWRDGKDLPTTREVEPGGVTRYRLKVAHDAELAWTVQPSADGLILALSTQGEAKTFDGLEMIFPFDPRVTPTTILPSRWDDDGTLRLPAVLSAPGFGQLLFSGDVSGRFEGDREKARADLVLVLPPKKCTLSLAPLHLPAPKGLEDASLWKSVRRGWFGAWQASARWGSADRPFSAPAGVLANNVISDPGSMSLWFYADQAFWTPELAPQISIMNLVRRSLDWWLDHRMKPTGEMIGYWDHGNFLDANAGPLIAAWDYVEATGDREWLTRRIERLERIADFLAARDIDDDGLVEAVQSGNDGTLRQPGRSCSWWDALNCGHKDAYSNALIYRAWRCLADLEAKLDRSEVQARYHRLADRLKASYARTLFNPATGWLAWWKSADGKLHDYASPVVNGLAIEYGLVEPQQGKEILKRLREKMLSAGFTRFELGVPPMLVPVRRCDYLLPDALGCPTKDDGTDTFGVYMNGGITAGHVLHFLAAHYVVGEGSAADSILRSMIGRLAEEGFDNGVTDKAMKGIDWTTWDGKPCGYEGYLADSYRFLQAVLLREPLFRARLYRPLERK